MGFLSKVGKFAKKAAKVYANYQTGGLAGVAISALSKKGRAAAPAPMVPPMTAMMSSSMTMAMRDGPMPNPSMDNLPALQLTQASLPTRTQPVSMLSTIGRTVGAVARKSPSLLRRVAPIVGRSLPGVGTAIGAIQLGRELLGSSRSTRVAMGMGRRYRRMNPANAKAAMRAVRRIKATRKLLSKIERSLPKRREHHAPPRAHCPPPRRRR